MIRCFSFDAPYDLAKFVNEYGIKKEDVVSIVHSGFENYAYILFWEE